MFQKSSITLSLAGILALIACRDDAHLFRRLDADWTGITFNNRITTTDSINILENEFTYNGAGVAVGDLNGDGLQDMYFCGNQVPNRLYVNRGGMHFEDITDASGAQKKAGQWSSGVTMVDVNVDGRLDIHVCNTMMEDSALLRDLLFINQGNDGKGNPRFKEMAAEYGITDDTHNSISTYLDYDRDGDLDLFVAVNFIDMQYPNQFITRIPDGKSPTRDLLYRNDFDSALGHAVFTDVSLPAGIIWGGYSHSALVHDFNEDGFSDIYVANDYLSNDLLYINNADGTFTNRIAEILKHQSYSSMGSDLGDINHDGKDDLFTVEMLPADNKRKKVNMNANNYNHYLFTEQYKYEYQFVRNTFQVYQGRHPRTGLPVYSDIAFMAGVEATDWSWSPLLADFDNDGNRDLLITNGFPKDIIDHDFGAFRNSISSSLVTRQQLHDMIPEVKIPNYVFQGNGDMTFTDRSAEWGIQLPSFTNGTAYADLDNDGDLDIITNNINDPAFVFENTLYGGTAKTDRLRNGYLRVSLKGTSTNPQGFGARVSIWHDGIRQTAESQCVRGYLSKSESILHFGTGGSKRVDSLLVEWGDGRTQRMDTLSVNRTLQLSILDAVYAPPKTKQEVTPLLQEVEAASLGIEYVHQENDFIDFNLQKTLPHKFSQYGPSIAVGDVNGDRLDDMVLGSSSRFQGPDLLLQSPGGRFVRKSLNLKQGDQMKEEDTGLLLFDADGDGDNDLYVARGSYQHEPGSPLYRDLLCVNDGKGAFAVAAGALPEITASGQPVKGADMDGDGDIDLFVGARVEPRSYPKPGRSYLLRNDSKPGMPRFTDVTASWYPGLERIGLVSDALWTDFDNDGRQDLIIAREWMPLAFLRNTGGRFEPLDPGGALSKASGWWNSLSAADLDDDGDMDYVAGNFGLNQYFKCSSGEPLRIYGKDFDKNGAYDAFISCYFPDSSGRRHEYFFHTKDDMQKQLILIRKKYEKYADFGRARASDVFTREEMKGVEILEANYMKSVWIENLGSGGFAMHDLPLEAQMAPVYGIQCRDADGDGNQDILLIGNDFGMETGQGRADAFNGLLLVQKVKGRFSPLGFNVSGFFVPGDARALACADIGGQPHFIATQNRSSLALFRPAGQVQGSLIRLEENEVRAAVRFKGSTRLRLMEFSRGSGFQSQDGRFVTAPRDFQSIAFFGGDGRQTRTITNTP